MHRSLAALLLLLAACSGGGQGPAAEHPEGEKLYRAMCLMCHGAPGNGGSLAPPLADLADNWTREELAEYLADPRSVVERTPRLQELKRRYGSEMPALTLPEDQRLALADYALALSAARVTK